LRSSRIPAISRLRKGLRRALRPDPELLREFALGRGAVAGFNSPEARRARMRSQISSKVRRVWIGSNATGGGGVVIDVLWVAGGAADESKGT
jgi:hypothetical protein